MEHKQEMKRIINFLRYSAVKDYCQIGRYVTDEGTAYLRGAADNDNLMLIKFSEVDKLKEENQELKLKVILLTEEYNDKLKKLSQKGWWRLK